MNLLGRHSLNVEAGVKVEEHPQPKRAFGRDLTNVLGGGVAGRPGSRHKRAESELAGKEVSVKPPTKPQVEPVNVLLQYEREHFRVMCQQDQQPVFTSLLGITPKMRNILIDWLIDVHSSFNLSQRTLHLAYKYLDCYLCLKEANRSDLQLIGITCLCIASKYEEIYPPRVRVFVDVTANTYTTEQLLDMEMKVITTLNFQLVKPTAFSFVQMLGVVSQNRSLTLYAIELATLEGFSLKYRQAVLASAAIHLSDSVLKAKTPLKELNDLVPARQLAECFKQLCSTLSEPNRYGLKALSRKYGQSQWHAVSKVRLSPND